MGRSLLGACALALVTTSVCSADVVEQQLNGPPAPGPFFWAVPDIGWYWTPTSDYDLAGVQTQLTTGFNNINNNFTFTTTLYTDRPAAGGTPIASFDWNGATFVSGNWVGGSFPSPVPVSAATQYFVGMSGWANALNWNGANSGAGINWIDTPLGAPVENLGAGSSYRSANTPGSFDTQLSPGGLGATDQPVIRFLSVPAPASLAPLVVGLCGITARRRR